MHGFRKKDKALIFETNQQVQRIEPWGRNTLRVRITKTNQIPEKPDVLLKPVETKGRIEIKEDCALIKNDRIYAEVSNLGYIKFHRTSDDKVLLEEELPLWEWAGIKQSLKTKGGKLYEAEVNFKAYEHERIYGLGQHRHGLLDQKGSVIDLLQTNSE